MPMSSHLTRLNQYLTNGETEIVTEDIAVQQKAEQARQERTIVAFAYWNGHFEEEIEGAVMTCRPNPPFRFSVERRPR